MSEEAISKGIRRIIAVSGTEANKVGLGDVIFSVMVLGCTANHPSTSANQNVTDNILCKNHTKVVTMMAANHLSTLANQNVTDSLFCAKTTKVVTMMAANHLSISANQNVTDNILCKKHRSGHHDGCHSPQHLSQSGHK